MLEVSLQDEPSALDRLGLCRPSAPEHPAQKGFRVSRPPALHRALGCLALRALAGREAAARFHHPSWPGGVGLGFRVSGLMVHV